MERGERAFGLKHADTSTRRADESTHRCVNHTLGNLDQQNDPNPFVSSYKDMEKPHPGKGLENMRATGWERKDAI